MKINGVTDTISQTFLLFGPLNDEFFCLCAAIHSLLLVMALGFGLQRQAFWKFYFICPVNFIWFIVITIVLKTQRLVHLTSIFDRLRILINFTIVEPLWLLGNVFWAQFVQLRQDSLLILWNQVLQPLFLSCERFIQSLKLTFYYELLCFIFELLTIFSQ